MNRSPNDARLKESEFNVFVSSLREGEILFFNTRTGYFCAFHGDQWEQVSAALDHPDDVPAGPFRDLLLKSGMLVLEKSMSVSNWKIPTCPASNHAA